MRKPIQTKLAKDDPARADFPKGVKYTGAVEFRGAQRWVPGAYSTAAKWEKAARQAMEDLRREYYDARAAEAVPAPAPTVSEFTGLRVDARSGRVVPLDGLALDEMWPWTHARGGSLRKESSKRRYSEALRGFVRDHGCRTLDSFTRVEAKQWQRAHAQHQREAVRRLFGDALDDEVIRGPNPFRGAGAKKRRKHDPDFEIVDDAFVERLLAAALQSRADHYGRTLHAIVLLEATSGMRPSEIFGTSHHDVHVADGYIDVRWQIDDRGVRVPVKNELRRKVPLTPRMVAAYPMLLASRRPGRSRRPEVGT